MKKIIYIFSAALLCLVACTRENIPVQRHVSTTSVAPKDGDMALVTFTISIPETVLYANTRANESTRLLGEHPLIEDGDLYLAVFGGGDNVKFGGALQHFLQPHLKGTIVHNDDGSTTSVTIMNESTNPPTPRLDENGDPRTMTVRTYSVQYEVLMPLSNEPLVLDFLVGACDEKGKPFTLDNPIPSTIEKNGKMENAYEADLMPMLFSKAGEAAYWQRVRIAGVFANKPDGEYETSTYIIGYDEDTGDPQYSEDEDYVAAPIEELHDVPLIRNFAKVTFLPGDRETDDFVVTGFTLIDLPHTGAVVPYSGVDGYNTIYTQTNKTTPVIDADDVTTHYVGYVNSKVLDKSNITAGMDLTSPGDYEYMYERTVPTYSPLFAESGAILEVEWLKGDLAGATRYYKVSFMDSDGYVPILRNIQYQFQVDAISTDTHYEDAKAAYDGDFLGDISASISTSMLGEIGNMTSKIQVSTTSITNIGAKKERTVTFKFYPVASSDNYYTASSGDVSIDIIKSEVGGHEDALEGDIQNDGNGTLTVTLKASEADKELKTKVRIQGRVEGKRALYREVMFTVLPLQQFKAGTTGCSVTKLSEDAVDQDVTVTIVLPDELPRDLFPLNIMIEPQNNGLRSVSHKYTEDGVTKTISALAVNHGPSAFNSSKRNYFFVKTITYDDYAELKGSVYEYTNEFPCYFKTRLSTGNETAIMIYDEKQEIFIPTTVNLSL